jgi:hypothetical protein
MKKLMVATLMAGSLSLGACASTYEDQQTLEGAGTGAAVGAAVGAGAGALIGGLGVIEGAAIGAAIGGIAGAIWADRDGDGRVDGYYQNGTYYQGRPPENAYAPPPPPPPPAPVYRSGERG